MEKLIKSLFRESLKQKKTLMEALIMVITGVFIILGIVFRKQIVDYFKKEDKPIKDTDLPLPIPPIVKPEKPSEPEIERNIIAEFEPYNGTPVSIPATEDNSFVDEKGNVVPFTIRIPLLINENDTGFIISKSDRELGTEWGLRPYKGTLQFEMSRNSNVRDKIRINIPLNKLPKELFDLVIPIDFSGDNRSVEMYINARRVGYDVSASSFTGFEKTNAPIRVGDNGWNDDKYTGQTGPIIVEKGRTWKTDGIIEAYQDLFNITDLFLKPSEDGKVHIPVEPNTEQEKGSELLEAFRKVRNGSYVLVEFGKYLVNMIGADYSQAVSSVELYGKENITRDFQNATLYTTQFSIDDLSGDGTTHRVQLRNRDSKKITTRNLNIQGVYFVELGYLAAIGFEHGIADAYCDGLVYENIVVRNVGGDGLYFKYCINVTLRNILTDGTNRMGIGVSHGTYNLKIIGYVALNCKRAAIDLEGDGTYSIIDGVDISESYLTTYIAAGGNSRINNVNIHHNKRIKDIIMKGNMWTANPDYNPDLEESESNPKNIALEPRENWIIDDNELIGGFGTPMSMIRIRYCKDVKIRRNKNILVPISQGRSGIALDYCSGIIEITENKYENPCIHRILKAKSGTKVIIDEPNNDNVYAIEIADEPLRLIGTDTELLAMVFTRSVEFLSRLLLGETEVIKEAFIKYPKLFKDVEIPDWDFTLDVSTVADMAAKDEHILYYFFVVEYEALKFILKNNNELLEKFKQ